MLLGSLVEEAMRIEDILQVVQSHTVREGRPEEITGVACDSRRVKPGTLFVAIPGAREDGTRYVEDALRRGASAIVSQSNIPVPREISFIGVEDAHRALAEISCAFYGHPSSRLPVVGITGTNGKTTTSFMLRNMLRAADRRPGLIGTVEYEIGARCIPAGRTTPEAPEIQYMLDAMVRGDCGSAVMEVSSHALDQKRVWGVDFDVGVFTNLTQDHLDYHGTMDRYFAAKALLFQGLGHMEKPATAVINIDDPWGQMLAQMGGAYETITYGIHEAAMVQAVDIESGIEGSEFTLHTPWGSAPVRLNVVGRYNVHNAMAAVGAAGALGLPLPIMTSGLASFRPAPGRMEAVENTRGFKVFVDYAHTPDALAHAVNTLREVTERRLIVIFGCGGDRDRGKRPQMAAAAAAAADHILVTNDNPRSEDPAAIAHEIEAGFPEGTHYETILDRASAIERAIRMARPGDVVLIAGKGHETYQEFQRTVVPFDDRETARRVLA